MATIYLDHHFIGKEEYWPIIEKILSHKDQKLVVSIWNFVEIMQGEDVGQFRRRRDFLYSLSPSLLATFLTIQRAEVLNFLCAQHWRVEGRKIGAILSSMSKWISVELGRSIRDDYSIVDFLGDDPRKHRGGLQIHLEPHKHENVNALEAFRSI